MIHLDPLNISRGWNFIFLDSPLEQAGSTHSCAEDCAEYLRSLVEVNANL
jgi:hypothetical protein